MKNLITLFMAVTDGVKSSFISFKLDVNCFLFGASHIRLLPAAHLCMQLSANDSTRTGGESLAWIEINDQEGSLEPLKRVVTSVLFGFCLDLRRPSWNFLCMQFWNRVSIRALALAPNVRTGAFLFFWLRASISAKALVSMHSQCQHSFVPKILRWSQRKIYPSPTDGLESRIQPIKHHRNRDHWSKNICVGCCNRADPISRMTSLCGLSLDDWCRWLLNYLLISIALENLWFSRIRLFVLVIKAVRRMLDRSLANSECAR